MDNTTLYRQGIQSQSNQQQATTPTVDLGYARFTYNNLFKIGLEVYAPIPSLASDSTIIAHVARVPLLCVRDYEQGWSSFLEQFSTEGTQSQGRMGSTQPQRRVA